MKTKESLTNDAQWGFSIIKPNFLSTWKESNFKGKKNYKILLNPSAAVATFLLQISGNSIF